MALSACGGDAADTSSAVATTSAGWTLVSLGDLQPAAAVAPTLHFDDANSVTGSAGCNRFMGAYRRNGDSLYITSLALTRKQCAEPTVMMLEARYIAALENALSVEQTDSELTIRSETESAPLIFERLGASRP